MSNRPREYKYSKDHEWLREAESNVIVGITDYAQEELGDVVYVDLPKVGQSVSHGSPMFTVESVKAVSDIYAPVDGEIIEVNQELVSSPQLVNESPFEEGWMVKIKPTSDASHLMDVEAYNQHVSSVSK
jgi:glycine cleavage system H protein